jgi:hypothetical protein
MFCCLYQIKRHAEYFEFNANTIESLVFGLIVILILILILNFDKHLYVYTIDSDSLYALHDFLVSVLSLGFFFSTKSLGYFHFLECNEVGKIFFIFVHSFFCQLRTLNLILTFTIILLILYFSYFLWLP